MVVYEVLTRKVPWSSAARVQDMFLMVVIKRQRPDIPADSPVNLADIARACWADDPAMRPQFSSVMKCMGSHGWEEA